MPPSLNPALEDVRFCPRCGSDGLIVDFPRMTRCEACGRMEFFNPKPVAAAVVLDPMGGIVLHRRGFDPGKGLWTFPGGFVDLGESVEDAARREAREEMAIDIRIEGLLGVYSRPDDRVVLVVFRATTTDDAQTTPEALEVASFAPDDLPWDELAFPSTAEALRDLLDRPG